MARDLGAEGLIRWIGERSSLNGRCQSAGTPNEDSGREEHEPVEDGGQTENPRGVNEAAGPSTTGEDHLPARVRKEEGGKRQSGTRLVGRKHS